MAKCAAITRAGTACKGTPIDDSGYCYVHHPDHAEERKRYGSKGGKRGGRGRPVSELSRLASRLEELAEKVLSGEVDRGDAAVAGQLLGAARACHRDVLSATEQQLRDEVEELEIMAEERRIAERESASRRGGIR